MKVQKTKAHTLAQVKNNPYFCGRINDKFTHYLHKKYMNTTLLFMGIGTQEFLFLAFNHPAAVRRKEDSRTDERYWQKVVRSLQWKA